MATKFKTYKECFVCSCLNDLRAKECESCGDTQLMDRVLHGEELEIQLEIEKAVEENEDKMEKEVEEAIAEKEKEQSKIKSDELFDEQIPKYAIQPLSTRVLVKIAKGEINTKKLARDELASRGLDINGNWISHGNGGRK